MKMKPIPICWVRCGLCRTRLHHVHATASAIDRSEGNAGAVVVDVHVADDTTTAIREAARAHLVESPACAPGKVEIDTGYDEPAGPS